MYDQSGTTSIRECVTQDEPAPPQSTLDVSAVTAGRQRGTRSTQGGSQQTLVEYRRDGVHLVELVIDDRSSGRLEFRPQPPLLLYPSDARPGRTWRGSVVSTDRQYNLAIDATVQRVRETVRTGDGRTLDATRLGLVSRLTGTSPVGAIDLRVRTTSWIATAPVIVVREISDTDGTVGTCQVSSHLEALLRSIRPG